MSLLEKEPIRYLGDVRRLALQPGDCVVVSIDRPISMDNAERIREFVERAVPGHRCLVLSDGLRIDVAGAPAERQAETACPAALSA